MIQSPHEKDDVCFNSVLLKIGNTRETIADMNSCWSDKLEQWYRPGNSDMVFPFPQLFFFFFKGRMFAFPFRRFTCLRTY